MKKICDYLNNVCVNVKIKCSKCPIYREVKEMKKQFMKDWEIQYRKSV